MPNRLNPRNLSLLLALFIWTTPAYTKEPEAKQKESLPEIVPDTPETHKTPPLEEVMQATETFFSEWKGYEPGDYLTRNRVKPLFRQLQKLGWSVKAEKEILNRIHAESDYLSQQLGTKKGKVFMRRVSRMPGGYDRLDHLLAMPYGKRNIRDFINEPGGFLMIEYMTTTKGGKNLGKYLSKAKTGTGFNKPTSYIYTETELMQALKKAYEKEFGKKQKR